MAFKRVRPISEWKIHFEGSSFNFLHSQGLCIVSTTHEDGTVTQDGILTRVMNQETRQIFWMLKRPKCSARVSRWLLA